MVSVEEFSNHHDSHDPNSNSLATSPTSHMLRTPQKLPAIGRWHPFRNPNSDFLSLDATKIQPRRRPSHIRGHSDPSKNIYVQNYLNAQKSQEMVKETYNQLLDKYEQKM